MNLGDDVMATLQLVGIVALWLACCGVVLTLLRAISRWPHDDA